MATRAARLGEKEWQKRVSEWQQSGKSQIDWCKERNISTKTFGRWKARFQVVGTRTRASTKRNQDQSQSFIPLKLMGDAADIGSRTNDASTHSRESGTAISIGVGRYSVTVLSDFDPAFLKRLLVTLSEVA